MNLKNQERLLVEKDGEEITVFNWVNVTQPMVVWGYGTSERFEPYIGAGDMDEPPEYITDWLAEKLNWELGVDVESLGIEVVDVESDEVVIL